ncbi:hypothetical protein AAFF39_02550 [Lactococcus garvieae]
MKNLFASSRNGEENSVAQNEGRTMIHLEEFNKLREELEANNQSLKDALHKTEGEKHKVIVERKNWKQNSNSLKQNKRSSCWKKNKQCKNWKMLFKKY